MAETLLTTTLAPDDDLTSLTRVGRRAAASAVSGRLPRSIVDPKAARGRFEVPVPPGPQPPSEPPPPDQPPPDPPPDPRMTLAHRGRRPVEA
jgi:hypothetical protein